MEFVEPWTCLVRKYELGPLMLPPCYIFKQMSQFTGAFWTQKVCDSQIFTANQLVIFTTDTGLVDEFMQHIHACAIYKQIDFGENLKHRKNDNELLWGFKTMAAQRLNPTTFRMTSVHRFWWLGLHLGRVAVCSVHVIKTTSPVVLVTNWKLKGQQHMARGLMGLPN